MITKAQLQQYHAASVRQCDAGALADAAAVAVDRSLPVDQRLSSFIAQVRNPYLFRVGDVVVKVEHTGTRPLPEALARVFSAG